MTPLQGAQLPVGKAGLLLKSCSNFLVKNMDSRGYIQVRLGEPLAGPYHATIGSTFVTVLASATRDLFSNLEVLEADDLTLVDWERLHDRPSNCPHV